MVLLDQLLTNKDLEQVQCCNELNCDSTEGSARACGAGAAVVTFSVGGLSAINAIAGAYAENLPVILVSGAPQHERSCNRASDSPHAGDARLVVPVGNRKKLTCAAAPVTSAEDAPHQIDYAIRSAQSAIRRHILGDRDDCSPELISWGRQVALFERSLRTRPAHKIAEVFGNREGYAVDLALPADARGGCISFSTKLMKVRALVVAERPAGNTAQRSS